MIAVFLLGYDDDFSTFQERFESFLLELEKQRKTKVEEVSLYLALFPGAGRGRKSTWYTLFAHVPNRPRNSVATMFILVHVYTGDIINLLH